jgi:hypothetical protein
MTDNLDGRLSGADFVNGVGRWLAFDGTTDPVLRQKNYTNLLFMVEAFVRDNPSHQTDLAAALYELEGSRREIDAYLKTSILPTEDELIRVGKRLVLTMSAAKFAPKGGSALEIPEMRLWGEELGRMLKTEASHTKSVVLFKIAVGVGVIGLGVWWFFFRKKK